MRIYHNPKKVKKLMRLAKNSGYERLFIQLNRTIPELRLYKGNILEADEYDKKNRSYIIYTGYGNIKIWKSSCRQIYLENKS